jgi:hypothetical protein
MVRAAASEVFKDYFPSRDRAYDLGALVVRKGIIFDNPACGVVACEHVFGNAVSVH